MPPLWYNKGRGWTDHQNFKRYPVKPNHAFIWPRDQGQGSWRRWKDLATGKGPDMFIASNPNRPPGASDGPTRRRWTGFPEAESNWRNKMLDANNHHGSTPWASQRNDRPYYDFAARRYRRRPHDGMWTDVKRYPGAPNNMPASIETFPYMNEWIAIHPWGNHMAMDPRNFGQNYTNGWPEGDGGYWHPAIDGHPGDPYAEWNWPYHPGNLPRSF